MRKCRASIAIIVCCALAVEGAAGASPPTPGYPEAVVQWGVQKGETCEDIAKALYGSAKHAPLVQRYNHVPCKSGAPLREGMTLVLPESPTALPDARLKSMSPDVRARPGSGDWTPAAVGMPLYSNYNVNTLAHGRADIEFIDRTRVFLAPNTLVVLYGTASQTRVSKTPPAAVEVDSGEIKAGLAALRDDAVEVAIKGGGRVSAESRDTVVERKGERTTVAVFDGRAGVTSGGASVSVPKNFGTRFVGVAPPVKPRPLPPAPLWELGGTGATALAPGGVGAVTASWKPVAGAIAYRVELARDDSFHDLVVREEVPASTTAFHGERFPVGTYFLAVRAIDKEEYLGIASEARVIRLVEVHIDAGGVVRPEEIEVNPYGLLRLTPSPNVEMAVDDGPFGPIPDVLELRGRGPRELRLRPRAAGHADVEAISVRYTRVAAAIEPAPAPSRALGMRVTLSGVEGIDVPNRIGPSARVHFADGVRVVALAPEPGARVLTGVVELPSPKKREAVRVDVVDDRGAVLGTAEIAPFEPPPPPADEARPPILGAYAPLWLISPSADVTWFAPTPPNGAAVSVGTARAQGKWTFQGQVRASGAVGPAGLEAAIRSDTTDDKTAAAAAWLGARWRLTRADDVVGVAPAIRVGFPASSAGAPAQIEPAIAVGGLVGRFTWLVDVGGRARLEDNRSAMDVPSGQAFVIAGGTMDVISWLRVNAALDAHLVVLDGGAKNGLAGLTLGAEAGTTIYGGLALRLAPWSDVGVGPFTAQLALGFRGAP